MVLGAMPYHGRGMRTRSAERYGDMQGEVPTIQIHCKECNFPKP